MKVDVVSLAAEFPSDNPALHSGVSWVCLELTGPPVAIRAPLSEPRREEAVPDSSETTCCVSLAAAEAPASMSVAELLSVESHPDPSEIEIPLTRISGIVGLGETPRDDSEPQLISAAADAAAAAYAADADDEELIVVEDLPPLDETATLEGGEQRASEENEDAPTTTIVPPASDDPWVVFVSTLADVAIGAGSPYVASVVPGLLLDGTLEGMPEDAMRALADADVLRGNVVTATFLAQSRAWRGILLGTGDDFASCGHAMLDEWGAELLARLLGAPSRATALKRELRSRGVAAFGLVEAA